MYPGIACNKIIPIHKTKIDRFNQAEDFAIVSSLTIPLANIGEKKRIISLKLLYPVYIEMILRLNVIIQF